MAAVLAAAPATALAEWSEPVELASFEGPAPSGGSDALALAARDDRAVAAWSDAGGDGALAVRPAPGGAWSALAAPSSRAELVGIDGDGDVIALERTAGATRVHRRLAAGVWASPATVPAGARVVVDHQGSTWASWTDGVTGWVSGHAPGASGWSAPEALPAHGGAMAGSPTVASGPWGAAVAAWTEPGGGVWASARDGSGWQAPARLAGDIDGGRVVEAAAFGSDGTGHVLWSAGSDSGDRWARWSHTGGWQTGQGPVAVRVVELVAGPGGRLGVAGPHRISRELAAWVYSPAAGWRFSRYLSTTVDEPGVALADVDMTWDAGLRAVWAIDLPDEGLTVLEGASALEDVAATAWDEPIGVAWPEGGGSRVRLDADGAATQVVWRQWAPLPGGGATHDVVAMTDAWAPPPDPEPEPQPQPGPPVAPSPRPPLRTSITRPPRPPFTGVPVCRLALEPLRGEMKALARSEAARAHLMLRRAEALERALAAGGPRRLRTAAAAARLQSRTARASAEAANAGVAMIQLRRSSGCTPATQADLRPATLAIARAVAAQRRAARMVPRRLRAPVRVRLRGGGLLVARPGQNLQAPRLVRERLRVARLVARQPAA